MKVLEIRMMSGLRIWVKNEGKMIENRIRMGIKERDKGDKGASHSTGLSPQEPHAPIKSWPHTKGFSQRE